MSPHGSEMEEHSSKVQVSYLSPPQDFRGMLLEDVNTAFSKKPYWLPCKYRYDEEGSRLCEELTKTPEYYLARAEIDILREKAKELMQLIDPVEVIELGSGYSTKTRIIIEAMKYTTKCRHYTPFEISEAALREAANTLTLEYDWLEVCGLLGDYDKDLPLIPRKVTGPRLIAFFGNTIGNYASQVERVKFFSNLKAIMVKGDAVLIAMDLVKDPSILCNAYKDSMGFNKAFNLRPLAVINNELESNFILNDFAVQIRWDAKQSAVVTALEAGKEMIITSSAIPLKLKLSKGDEIIVGISHKFNRAQVSKEIASVGLEVHQWYTDTSERVAMLLATCMD